MLTKRKILLAISVLIIVLVLFYIIPLFFKSDKEAYQFVSTWGSEGSQPGQFSGPIGIAIDKAGFIYVSDAENDRIQKFTSDGSTWWISATTGFKCFNKNRGGL